MAARKIRALWLEPPGHSRIQDERLGTRKAGQLRVRSLYSAVSRGTETRVYQGRVPPSEYERMRAPFQSGKLPGPVKHGYANVGVVEAGPNDWKGRTVFGLFPHQTEWITAPDNVVPVPHDVPAQRAVLGANMETAVNALWDAAPRVGDHISVVGAGVVGALIAKLCGDLPGADVELIDIDRRKAFLGQALGVDFHTPDTASGERDVVFHASTTAAGLDTALNLAGFESRVMELSWYGDQPVTLGLGGRFHSQRLTLACSQVGSISVDRRARWSHKDRLSLAIGLLYDARFDALIETDQPFEQLPAVMSRLASCNDATLCQRIRYD